MSRSIFLETPVFHVNLGFGHQTALDGIIKDGLWDVYNNIHMGSCAEQTAQEYNISREEQDKHAILSYTRAAEAVKNGWFKNEIAPVAIPGKKPVIIEEDEEYKNVDFGKLTSLKGAFEKNGTVTAGNSSTLSDGASALVLMTAAKARELGKTPLAKIVSYADAACSPRKFTVAPSLAIPKALKGAGLKVSDIDLFEINEAFSVVIKVNEMV
jgi:acetyl-CoA C-acetyltransferase